VALEMMTPARGEEEETETQERPVVAAAAERASSDEDSEKRMELSSSGSSASSGRRRKLGGSRARLLRTQEPGRQDARRASSALALPPALAAEMDARPMDSARALEPVNSATCLVDRSSAAMRDDQDDVSTTGSDDAPLSRSKLKLRGRARRYTPSPPAVPVQGTFRYLKPEEVQSGALPAYDFAIVVHRSVKDPGALERLASALCCCGGGDPPPPASSIQAGGCLSGMSNKRSGFRRLCNTASPRQSESEDEHRRIVDKLCGQGLFVDIIDGGHSKGEINSGFIVLLVRAADEVVHAHVTRFRAHMWVEHGAVVDMEQDVAQRRNEPMTPAERVEIVDYIIEQRANLSARDIWIHDMFPMHNKSVTDTLIARWVVSWRFFQAHEDQKIVRSLRYNFGEKVAYYFAFLGFYNKALVPIALLGIAVQLLHHVVPMETYMRILPFWGLGVSVVWSFSFLKCWERENACMQYEWNQKLHVKQIEYPNKRFHGEKRVNPVTGVSELVYPAWRRLPKYFCVFLFMLLQTVIMLVLVAVWVTIYEMLKATYTDSHIFSTQWFLILLEGIVFGLFVDVIQWNMVVTKMGKMFTHWENYRTEEQYEKALIRKLFILDFLNYYTWFFSLAFVFVIPGFGDYLTNSLNHMFFGDAMNCCFGPYVDQHGQCIICPLGAKDAACIECVGYFTFDRHHVDLSAMFVTPIVVTQSLNIVMGLVVPVLVRWQREFARARADAEAQKRVLEAGSMKILGALDYDDDKRGAQFGNKLHARYLEYSPSEIEVLNKKAREILFDSEQDAFDPYDDFHVLTVQFGFTVMFSILWPPMPLACFAINTLKGRTDGFRLCKTLKRPVPRRANGIGAWKGILTTYAYIAVVVNVLLICISTGSLEFFDDTCVRDIEHQLEKQGKTLEDFVFGPDFGCLHVAWRMLIILVLEHVLIAVAYVAMQRVPRVPMWIQEVMASRERAFKEVLRSHELDLFPSSGAAPTSNTTVAAGTRRASSAGKLSTSGGSETAPPLSGRSVTLSELRVDAGRLIGFGSSTRSMNNRTLSDKPAQQQQQQEAERPSLIIAVDPITPIGERDGEQPSSNGVRSKARAQLARQWSDASPV
jgi:anoctamin-10